jgi:hypothetical protein
MVAVEGHRSSPNGVLFNEIPDRFEDSIFIVAFGYAAGLDWLGYLAALLAMLTAYIRARWKATIAKRVGQTATAPTGRRDLVGRAGETRPPPKRRRSGGLLLLLGQEGRKGKSRDPSGGPLGGARLDLSAAAPSLLETWGRWLLRREIRLKQIEPGAVGARRFIDTLGHVASLHPGVTKSPSQPSGRRTKALSSSPPGRRASATRPPFGSKRPCAEDQC